MTTGRRAARRAALFVLYQWDVTGQPLASLYEGELDPYTRELAEGVAAEAQELDATIGTSVEGIASTTLRASPPSRRAVTVALS